MYIHMYIYVYDTKPKPLKPIAISEPRSLKPLEAPKDFESLSLKSLRNIFLRVP